MRSAYRSSSYRASASLRSRAVAWILSLAIMAAILLALVWISTAPEREPGDGSTLAAFDVLPSTRPAAATVREKPAEQPRTPPPPRAEQTPPPPVVAIPELPEMLRMNRQDFASSDIGAIRSAPPGAGRGPEVASSDAAAPSGQIPGPDTLFPADWYREPTRAEMATYMPPRAQVGWGMIACRTIDRFHVDDCRELGETPGSGIARGMRRAAWQFLIRPPQVNGKPMVGAWVRIRFDITRGVTG